MTSLFCRIFKRPNKTKKCIRLPTSDVLGANEAKNNKKPNEAVKFHLLGHSKVFSRWNWNLPVFRPTENLTSHGATIFWCFLMLFDTFWCYIVFVSFEPKADSQRGQNVTKFWCIRPVIYSPVKTVSSTDINFCSIFFFPRHALLFSKDCFTGR